MLGALLFLQAAACSRIRSLLIGNNKRKMLVLRKKCYVDTQPSALIRGASVYSIFKLNLLFHLLMEQLKGLSRLHIQ